MQHCHTVHLFRHPLILCIVVSVRTQDMEWHALPGCPHKAHKNQTGTLEKILEVIKNHIHTPTFRVQSKLQHKCSSCHCTVVSSHALLPKFSMLKKLERNHKEEKKRRSTSTTFCSAQPAHCTESLFGSFYQ
jgi:hypothetical protein